MIYEAIFQSPAVQAKGNPFLSRYRGSVMHLVVMQTMRTNEFLLLYEKLRNDGLTPCVVKGIICRQLYPDPDARISADEDLFITEKEFSRAHQCMLEYGMVLSNPEENIEEPYEVSSIFLPRKSLEGRFPYLRTCPFLLPVAWIQRLWFYYKETARSKTGNNAAESIKIGSQRVELLRKYGIIK